MSKVIFTCPSPSALNMIDVNWCKINLIKKIFLHHIFILKLKLDNQAAPFFYNYFKNIFNYCTYPIIYYEYIFLKCIMLKRFRHIACYQKFDNIRTTCL